MSDGAPKKPRRLARAQRPARDRLTQSQIVLMAALESNQAALLDRFEELFRPLEAKVDELTTLLHGALGQIEQIHERQEQQERLLQLPAPDYATIAASQRRELESHEL